MKLIKCHIENFGKLQNFDFNFSDGLNSIKHENGWGKSTFATFIKSMFYGLVSTTKRDLDENERKKYLPWQGGNYGGNIDFEVNDKQYRIERFFGKNNSEDTFKLIDLATGKRSVDFSSSIGEELFGLDQEAFERSSFIPQKDIDARPNDSINNKLTNLIQGTSDKFNYDEAQEILNKKRVSLYNNKGSGEIQEIESDIEDLLRKINDLEVETRRIPEIQNQINTQEAEIQNLINQQNEVKKQISDYGKYQQKIANQELYEKLVNQITTTQFQITENEKLLNGKDTSLTEVSVFEVLNNKVLQNEKELDFKNKNNYLKTRHEELLNYFGGESSIPATEKIEEISHNIIKYNALSLSINESANSQSHTVNIAPRAKIGIPLVICAVCALFAVGLIAFVLPIALALFAAAFLCLLIAGFLYLKNLINERTSSFTQSNHQILNVDQPKLEELKTSIERFLKPYEPNCYDFQKAINNLIANNKELQNIKQQLQKLNSENNIISQQILQDIQKIENYLAQFNFNINMSNEDKLNCLKQTLINIANLKEQLINDENELNKFKAEKNFDTNCEQVRKIDINVLQEQEKSIQNKIDDYRDIKSQKIALINKIQDDISVLDDFENEKESLEVKLQTLKKELFAVKNAKKFLEEANDSLSSQFLAPMKNGLTKYLKMITDKNFDNLKMDTNFNIDFEEYGKLREINYYSKGYKNIFDLCMRFALIDALYDKEKPFVVLDDPFVNMDESKINNVKCFMQELAKNYQVIYFSCHESRC